MKKIIMLAGLVITIIACGGKSSGEESSTPPPKSMISAPEADDGKGIGEIKSVTLNNPLDQTMVEKGKGIYDMKCAACHKLSATRVVGPGFKGVTERRQPEWIMNMITNVEIMLDEDPEARKLFEECLTRMPNQNVTLEDARSILEFFYENDSKG